jgi:sugar phosphate isomerase/epimerase
MALESFMLGGLDLAMLKDGLDRFDLYRMWAWGHPHGFGSGTMPEALTDLTRHVDSAAGVGTDVMRICAGGRRTRKLAWAKHRPLLLPLLHRAADYAGGKGVVLAIENHVDLSTDEMLPDADTAGLGAAIG